MNTGYKARVPLRSVARVPLLLLVTIAGFHPNASGAENELLTKLTAPLPEVPSRIQAMQRRMERQYDAQDYEGALASSQEIVSALEKRHGTPETMLIRPYLNLGVLQWITGDAANAMDTLARALAMIEHDEGVYSPALVAPLEALGELHYLGGDFEEAGERLRRAQHIEHRTEGVYTMDQADLVRMISRVAEKQGDRGAATQQRRFLLKINEVAFGTDSADLVPALEEFASYMESIDAYRDALLSNLRAIEIIEQKYGANDLRLTEPLEKIGTIGMHDVLYRTRAREALERRVQLLQGNENADLREQVLALTSLGDFDVVGGDKEARERYAEAWRLAAGRSGLESLLDDTFGTPIRLDPKPKIYIVDRFHRDTEDEGALYAEYEFTVNEQGRVEHVKLLETNVPWTRIKGLSDYIRHEFRYRPRIVDGIPVATEKLRLRQQVVMKQPETEVKFNVEAANPSGTP